MSSRTEFVGRIRAEMAKTRGLFPATPAARPPRPTDLADAIRRELAERWPQALDRFRAEFERVGGVFHRVRTSGDVAQIVGDIARERNAHRLITWPADVLGLDVAADLRRHGVETTIMPHQEVVDAERQRLREVIADADLGLTGVDLAVAETGSLVLRSGPGRPRSTSLLPPYHVAVFDRTALVESLEQVGVFLEAWHASPDASAAGAVITFITGPSRTADIELTLTRGVHGPKEVHAIFVEAPIRG